jgi:hypothetical protein
MPAPGQKGVEQYYRELKMYAIPSAFPTAEYADWQSFHQHYQTVQPKLSNSVDMYASYILLSKFNLLGQSASKEVTQAITFHLTSLILHHHQGYGLLYAGIDWLKKNIAQETAHNLIAKVVDYGKPLLPQPTAGKEGFTDPVFQKDPALAEKMRNYLSTAGENDNNLEKIKQLKEANS